MINMKDILLFTSFYKGFRRKDGLQHRKTQPLKGNNQKLEEFGEYFA
jgi:hypothetical protein